LVGYPNTSSMYLFYFYLIYFHKNKIEHPFLFCIMIPFFLLMRFTLFFVRCIRIILGSTQYIVESFQTLNTGTTLSEMFFLMFLNTQKYLRKKMYLWTFWQIHKSTLRLTDVMVYEWADGKHASVNLAVVSPFVRLKTETFTVLHVALQDASGKVVKHEKIYSAVNIFSHHLCLTLLTP
jgi:hypothetical protein